MNSIKVIQKVMKDKVHVPQKIRVIFAQYLDLVVVVFAAQQSACHTDGVVLLLVLTKNADVKRKLWIKSETSAISKNKWSKKHPTQIIWLSIKWFSNQYNAIICLLCPKIRKNIFMLFNVMFCDIFSAIKNSHEIYKFDICDFLQYFAKLWSRLTQHAKALNCIWRISIVFLPFS